MEKNSKSSQEVKRLRQAQSPYTVKLVEVIEEDDKIFIVMAYMSGGNLLSKVIQKGTLPESAVKSIARQLIEGVMYMHQNLSLCHNDLQPANLLFGGSIDKRRLRIADFGAATTYKSHGHSFSSVGQPPYRAPERQVSQAADMWSVGVILFFCLYGQHPCLEQGYDGLLNRLHKRPPQKTNKVELSRHAKQFLCSLIHLDPEIRLTAEEALSHPWLARPVENRPATHHDQTIERVRSHDSESSASVSDGPRKRRPGKRIASSLGRFVAYLKRSEEFQAQAKPGSSLDEDLATSESSH